MTTLKCSQCDKVFSHSTPKSAQLALRTHMGHKHKNKRRKSQPAVINGEIVSDIDITHNKKIRRVSVPKQKSIKPSSDLAVRERDFYKDIAKRCLIELGL